MKPILVEAAREKRKLRAEDVRELAGLSDGNGLALDDVLDFLLSPQGSHLQEQLATLIKPDRAILPFGDIDADDNGPGPSPWNAPPRDSFEARLRVARQGDAFGTSQTNLLNAAVKGFSEVTGKNGRIDEAALAQQGKIANALYAYIASKTQNEPQKSGMAGQKLTGLDPKTVVRLGAGVDVAPIRARMQAFDSVVDALVPPGTQPLKGVKVVAIQHLMPTLSGVLDALERAGVARDDMRLIGKSYSTVDEMYAWLNANGYHVDEGSIGGNAASVEERLVEAAKDTLTEIFDGIDPKTS
jgi:hypothetical protein